MRVCVRERLREKVKVNGGRTSKIESCLNVLAYNRMAAYHVKRGKDIKGRLTPKVRFS